MKITCNWYDDTRKIIYNNFCIELIWALSIHILCAFYEKMADHNLGWVNTHGFYIRWLLISLAHTWSKSGISICWRHLVTSQKSSNPIFFRKKTLFSSFVRNMKWATILFKNHCLNNVFNFFSFLVFYVLFYIVLWAWQLR